MEEIAGASGLGSLIDTGGGGFSGSSGVEGDDEQSFSTGVGGVEFGSFMSTTNTTLVPSWVWVVAAVLVIVFFLLKNGR